MIMSLGNTNFNASYIRCWDREKRLSGFNHSLKSEHIQKKLWFHCTRRLSSARLMSWYIRRLEIAIKILIANEPIANLMDTGLMSKKTYVVRNLKSLLGCKIDRDVVITSRIPGQRHDDVSLVQLILAAGVYDNLVHLRLPHCFLKPCPHVWGVY